MIINKNKILKIFLLILILISNFPPVLADNIKSDSDTSIESDDIWMDGKGSYKAGNKRYDYTYKYRLGVKKTINVNAYNLDGESLIPDSLNISQDIKKNKSGTWIGINTTENQTSYWELKLNSFKYTEIKRKYECRYSRNIPNCIAKSHQVNSSYCPENEHKLGCNMVKLESDTPELIEPEVCYAICQYYEKQGTKYMIDTTYVTKDWWGRPICPVLKKPDADNKCGEKSTDWALDEEQIVRNEEGLMISADIDGDGKPDNFENGYDRNVVVAPSLSIEVPGETTTSNSHSNEIKEEVITKLKGEAKALLETPPTELQYIKANKYPERLRQQDFGSLKAYSEDGIIEGEIIETSNSASGTYSIDYNISPSTVCISGKTSKVYYGDDCDNNNLIEPNEKITLENGTVYDENIGKDVEFWRYFIPLDTKSNSDFYLRLIKNESENAYSVNECESIMKYKEDYPSYITKLDGSSFEGDYGEERSRDKKYIDDRKSNVKKENINITKGCKLNIKVSFPIEQLFYNEIEKNDKLKFKGFNFYYKPIDINNPFPNGLNDTSIWKTWYDDMVLNKELNPDISDSYGNISYIANISNPEQLRRYNSQNKYTSWGNMNLDGTSSFIGDGLNSLGMIERFNRNLYNVYKLGCGEMNSDSNNQMLYIEACGDDS